MVVINGSEEDVKKQREAMEERRRQAKLAKVYEQGNLWGKPEQAPYMSHLCLYVCLYVCLCACVRLTIHFFGSTLFCVIGEFKNLGGQTVQKASSPAVFTAISRHHYCCAVAPIAVFKWKR